MCVRCNRRKSVCVCVTTCETQMRSAIMACHMVREKVCKIAATRHLCSGISCGGDEEKLLPLIAHCHRINYMHLSVDH